MRTWIFQRAIYACDSRETRESIGLASLLLRNNCLVYVCSECPTLALARRSGVGINNMGEGFRHYNRNPHAVLVNCGSGAPSSILELLHRSFSASRQYPACPPRKCSLPPLRNLRFCSQRLWIQPAHTYQLQRKQSTRGAVGRQAGVHALLQQDESHEVEIHCA